MMVQIKFYDKKGYFTSHETVIATINMPYDEYADMIKSMFPERWHTEPHLEYIKQCGVADGLYEELYEPIMKYISNKNVQRSVDKLLL